MHGTQGVLALFGAIDQLQEAARIAGRDPVGTRGRDVAQLRREHRIGCRGLQEIVDPGRPTALFGIRKRDER